MHLPFGTSIGCCSANSATQSDHTVVEGGIPLLTSFQLRSVSASSCSFNTQQLYNIYYVWCGARSDLSLSCIAGVDVPVLHTARASLRQRLPANNAQSPGSPAASYNAGQCAPDYHQRWHV